jgi:hypothetical protein
LILLVFYDIRLGRAYPKLPLRGRLLTGWSLVRIRPGELHVGQHLDADLACAQGTGEPIRRSHQATRTVLAEENCQHMLMETGFEPITDSTPEKFRLSLAADVALWTPVVKALALKID